eukprot:TRINITY_DN6010_c0_g1_i2.p1 TRINITY_DN6010_c0_g1~~TRINITY_DN6010_c0_g1_i2.p1  ORF type:complete len:326 (+),score=29.18 TRINITY_DN6010_c0_g1_i2:214-1191(+)
MSHKFLYSPAPLRKVTYVQFGLLSPDVIRQMSVVEVQHPERMEHGKPKEGGLSDLRMGNISREFKCTTCECDANECSGHFGHIELAKPMFHLGFMSTIVKILRCICFNCMKLKGSTSDEKFLEALKLPPKERLPAMYKLLSKKTKCADEPGADPTLSTKCGHDQPKIIREGFKLSVEMKGTVEGEKDGKTKEVLTAADVYEKFCGISDEDCWALGLDPEFSRPDWMIITVLPVPPPQVRPTIMTGSTTKGEDDLTCKLTEIVRLNQTLRKAEDNSNANHVIKDYTKLLQFHIATQGSPPLDSTFPFETSSCQFSQPHVKTATDLK